MNHISNVGVHLKTRSGNVNIALWCASWFPFRARSRLAGGCGSLLFCFKCVLAAVWLAEFCFFFLVITLVNVYVDLVLFTRIAGTS